MKCVRACDRGAIGSAATDAATRARSATHAKAVAPVKSTAAATPRALSAHSVTVGGFTWTILEAAAMLSVTFAAFMVKELFLASDVVRALPSEVVVGARAFALAIYYAVQVVLLRYLVRRRDGSFGDSLGLTRQHESAGDIATSIGLVAGGLVATRVIATVYSMITRSLDLMPSAGADTITHVFGTSVGGLALAAVMLVLIGPFVEECVFRGALMRGLEARIGAWPAIITQAVLFAAFHRSWWLLFPMTVLGVALGWLAHERKSLWPAIALHAAYNSLTVGAVVWLSRGVG
jgi:membrane protease YdiL (CAAX protease family)